MNCGIVIIPTYNEIENIESIVRAVFSLHKSFHILIVDDNSPDKTADKVRELQKEFSDKLFLEQREKKAGLGTAYVHGFKWALAKEYEFLFEMDADFSHNPHDLEKLHDACHFGGADLAIGSRYVTGVNVVNWPLSRVLLSYFASVYVRMITGMKIMDATAGFICYNRTVLESINYLSITEISPPVSGGLEVSLITALLFRHDTDGKSIGPIFESSHNVKEITYRVEA